MSYLRWWLKYRIPAIKFEVASFLKRPKRHLKNLFTFLTNDGVRSSDCWSTCYALSLKFLRMTYEFTRYSIGWPSSIPTPEAWAAIVTEMRFAHFWIVWEEFDASWMVESIEELSHAYRWMKKKYFWIAEFITLDFWKKWNTEQYGWALESTLRPIEGSKNSSIEFSWRNRKTGETVTEKPSVLNTDELRASLQERADKGWELFSKYYKDLWD